MIWFDSLHYILLYNIFYFFYSNIFNPFANCFIFLTFPPFLLTIGVDCNPDALFITGA